LHNSGAIIGAPAALISSGALMRIVYLLLVWAALACGQDTALLNKAYEALGAKRYDQAVAAFREGIAAGADRASVRKDLAYTYLKIGESEAARDEFREAMRLDPHDHHAALEYAFLCFETKQQAEARRVFDRVRKTGDPASRATAAQAFDNIDGPLKAGIARWSRVLEQQPDDFSAHQELATLAEQRDERELAAAHYRRAWELKPEKRGLLVRLGRMLAELGRTEEAAGVLVAASRGGEPHAADEARELLPARYPYVYEFESALRLDPKNAELRRELAYLFLRMDRQSEAEEQFRIVTQAAPEDLLSAAQLGFLYLARNDAAQAMPLLERVLKGADEDLANRVRAVLRLPQTLKKRSDARAESIEAKLMAERSWKAGYLKDARKYLHVAHEADPVDFSVMLRLGWVYNLLKDDAQAARWFNLARRSPDPAVAGEASQAYRGLRASLAQFRTTAWVFPMFSSRWRDVFSYSQVKTEWKPRLPIRPYLSLRFVGDARGSVSPLAPQYLSESAAIPAVGVATRAWRGISGWAEAGSAIAYRRNVEGSRVRSDYRGGVTMSRHIGPAIGGESAGWAYDVNADAVFVSRFDNDVLGVVQNRLGFVSGNRQLLWNWNLTTDARRQAWANFAETGPGVRFRFNGMPRSAVFSFDALRGVYLRNRDNPRRPNFFDFRTGFWYAFTY
jgi:Tfp pilus assembly protein PilF